MSDPDGSTESVRATVVFNVQNWAFNLTDEDGDGYWEGEVEMNPEAAGRPNLKVIATDGTGDNAMVDILSITLYVEESESDSRVMMFVLAGAVFVSILVIVAMVALRRQRKAELDMIDTWDSFGGFSSKPSTEKPSVNLEGGVVDGAEEVLAEDEILEQSDAGSLEETPTESQPVKGVDLDWDNV